jgi:hypothetical protein
MGTYWYLFQLIWCFTDVITSNYVYHDCVFIVLFPVVGFISWNAVIMSIVISNRNDDVMVSVLASSVVVRGFDPRSGQTKDYKIGICCFSAKLASLRRKSKYWLNRNQDNVSECDDMSIYGLLFQWTRTIKNPTKRVGLV